MRRAVSRELALGRPLKRRTCLIVATTLLEGHVAAYRCTAHPGFPLPNHERSPDAGPCALSRRGRLMRALAREAAVVVSLPGCPASVMTRSLACLACSPEPEARITAARHEACPAELQEILSHDWWWEVRAAMASNPACITQVSRSLATDEVVWVRRALAENRSTGQHVLAFLATDPDNGIRDAVAEHPHCPPDAIWLLARDPVWEIRRSIAKRADAPPEVLDTLAGDTEHWIRFFVACHPATRSETRLRLGSDPRPSVRATAMHADRAGAIVRHLALPPGSA